jgi:hypothetical protein
VSKYYTISLFVTTGWMSFFPVMKIPRQFSEYGRTVLNTRTFSQEMLRIENKGGQFSLDVIGGVGQEM